MDLNGGLAIIWAIVGTFFNFLSSFFVTNLCSTILLVCTTYK